MQVLTTAPRLYPDLEQHPIEAPSRAYLKVEEALRWAGAMIELRAGDTALEIGSAPGEIGSAPGGAASMIASMIAQSAPLMASLMTCLMASLMTSLMTSLKPDGLPGWPP